MTTKEKILLSSVYFGGGTPSLAPIHTLRRILQTVRDPDGPFELAKDAEISIEMDPGTFTLQKAKALKVLGINRISLGVQSFDDEILALLGRTHRRKDIFEALKILKTAFGMKLNYSVDLISGLPGLTCAKWVETLETVVNSLKPPPKHLSLYDLQVEKVSAICISCFVIANVQDIVLFSSFLNALSYGPLLSASGLQDTVFGIWYDPEKKTPYRQTKGESSPVPVVQLPSEDETAFMYKYASGYLHSKGFEHYEVSSYALKRDSKARSRHNQIYWDMDSEWYAVGLGSTSYVNETLVARPRALADYLNWVENHHENGGGNINHEQETLDEADLLMDVVMKRLRTSEGLSLPWVRRNFQKGEAYVKAVLEGAQLGIDLGLATMDSKGQLRLTDPDGFLYSNTIISTIFAELERIEAFARND